MAAKRKDILWFIVLRLIIITSLIVSALSIQFATSQFIEIINPLFLLILALYAFSALYLILYSWGKHYNFQAYLQIIVDLIFITVLVYLAGGLRGSFYFLYIFEIIAASIVLSGRATYLTAALSSIFFGILVDGMYLGVIPYLDSDQPDRLSFGFVLNHIVIAWGVFFLVAFLINRLTGSLSKTRMQLLVAQKELEVKKHLALAGEFSAQMAHEIRNPLAAISGSVQVLRDEVSLSGEQQNLMNIVIDESKRVSQSIEQFLNLATPDEQSFAVIDLPLLLNETIILQQKGGALDEKIKIAGNFKTVKVPYYASRNQFKQIFWNLIKNGIKAMPDGGTMTFDFIKEKKGELSLLFSDTGLGMNQEEQKRLFEPFYSGFQSGKGIGLAIVQRIVNDYNGRIEVTSAPGTGTTITIVLPAKDLKNGKNTDN